MHAEVKGREKEKGWGDEGVANGNKGTGEAK
jgi:hypothetical protein